MSAMDTEHPLYSTWEGMNQRCNNPNHDSFSYYGGRGIKVCERWKLFENFLADMGVRPDGKTIDRYPDNNGNYEPSNCRWATPSMQSKNSRLRRDNKSGCKGVFWFAKTNRWMVYINENGHRYDLGYYGDFFEACCVRKAAENCKDIRLFTQAVKRRLIAIPNKGNFKWRRGQDQSV